MLAAASPPVKGESGGPSAARNDEVDVASHFILRLACCGAGGAGEEGAVDNKDDEGEAYGRRHEASTKTSWDTREWFVRAEKALFRERLQRYLQVSGTRRSSGVLSGALQGGRSCRFR